MLDLSRDEGGIMDVSLIHIGLALISAFFILIGYVVIYENPLQTQSELDCIADHIHSMITEVDRYWFEAKETWLFPSTDQHIKVEISPETIRVSMSGSSQYGKIIRLPFLLWIVSTECSWSSSSCHQLLLHEFGAAGTRTDPLTNKTVVLAFLAEKWNQSQQQFHQLPLIWMKGEEMVFEKCILFEEKKVNGKEKSVSFLEFVIVRKC